MRVATQRRAGLAPTAEGREFQRLAQGIRTQELERILGVGRESIARYRYFGAPEERLERLRRYLLDQARRALE